MHNETLSVTSMCTATHIIHPSRVTAETTSPAPSGFAEIVSDYFPILHRGLRPREHRVAEVALAHQGTSATATVWQRSANAPCPLTSMVPLVSPVTRFEHWSVVKLPLAPAYRPVPPIMVQGSTSRRSPLAHKPEWIS